ncbi:hypothetical protein BGZ60DRAFT_395099 [Tricladium varicosporioides]|nr:hypothetical protein BGZ60DRAFT_395099 [Hymenoscyphus varicosporioides]
MILLLTASVSPLGDKRKSWSWKTFILLNLFKQTICSHLTAPNSLGAVASESKICSEIGIGLLKRGVSFMSAQARSRHFRRV